MSSSILLQVDFLVKDRKAGMDDPKVESDQSIAVGSHNPLNVVELFNLPSMVGRIGVGVLLEELVHANLAKGALASRTFAFEIVVQTKIQKSNVMFVRRADILCMAVILES